MGKEHHLRWLVYPRQGIWIWIQPLPVKRIIMGFLLSLVLYAVGGMILNDTRIYFGIVMMIAGIKTFDAWWDYRRNPTARERNEHE